MSDLPEGWFQKQGDEVFSTIRGVSYDKTFARSEPEEGLVPILRANNIQDGRINADDLVYVPAAYVAPQQYLQSGDILIATSSGSRDVVGKTAMAGPEHATFAFGAFCAVARPRSQSDATWLFHYTQSRAYREYVEAVALGININNFRIRDLAALPLPLPPAGEQRRIVAKLDSLFAHSKRAREELARIPRLVERTKQATLAVISTSDTPSSRLSSLASGVTQRSSKLRDVIVSLRTGPFGSSLHKSDYVEGGIPVVNPMHINDGQITPTVKMTVSEQKARELSEFRLSPGDIVIARRGVMGRCAVVSEDEAGWLCGTGSMAIRPRPSLTPAYLQLFLSSLPVVQALEAAAVGSTMTNLNQSILLDLDIRLPSIEEQNETVRRVETAFDRIDKLAAETARATALLDRLDQATLAKAFRGELLATEYAK